MRGTKRIVGLAVLAALALAITATAGGASTSDPTAHTAGLKSCLKKANKIDDPVKRRKAKKRCRKKFAKPTPMVRATLTWANGGSSNVDLDLFVFDALGRRAGNGTDAIPASTLSPDVSGPAGSETFTHLDFLARGKFSFGVCYAVGGSVHTPFTITYVTSDGVSHTDSQNPGSSFHYDYPADGVVVPSGYCPN